MVLTTILFLFIINILFENRMYNKNNEEEKYAVEELAFVGKAINKYLQANKDKESFLSSITGNTNDGNIKYLSVSASTGGTLINEISKYLPDDRSLKDMRNIWGDSYRITFIRSTSGVENSADTVSAYVIATGSARHVEGTEEGNRWINGGVRQAATRGGAAFGFVENGQVIGSGWSTSVGVAGARNGDLAFFVTYNVEDMASNLLMRYSTGDDEDNTLHKDLDMNNHNILNVQYIEAQAVDVSSVKLDPNNMFKSLSEAEDSCKNDWVYVTGGKTDGTKKGDGIKTFGMNNGPMASHVHITDDTDIAKSGINNVGRIYFINDSSKDINGQIAICRLVNGERTLAFLGDTKTEDRVAFVTTVTDGEKITKFSCPGDSTTGEGGKWISSKPGTMPRFFIMPHIISSGKKALPIQGIRAWLEDSGTHYVARLGVLVDSHTGDLEKRSYWVSATGGTTTSSTSSEDTAEVTATELHQEIGGTGSLDAANAKKYFRAVVIGVCSSKAEVF